MNYICPFYSFYIDIRRRPHARRLRIRLAERPGHLRAHLESLGRKRTRRQSWHQLSATSLRSIRLAGNRESMLCEARTVRRGPQIGESQGQRQ